MIRAVIAAWYSLGMREAVLLANISLATACARADLCREALISRDGPFNIVGRVTTERISTNEMPTLIKDGLDGVLVGRYGSRDVVATDATGCFVVPVGQRGPFIVEARMPNGQFLGARTVSLAGPPEAITQSPHLLEFSLTASSAIEVAGDRLLPDDEISVEQMFGQRHEVIPYRAQLSVEGVLVVASLAPGRYTLKLRRGNNLTYFTEDRSQGDPKIIELGCNPVRVYWSVVEGESGTEKSGTGTEPE